VRKSPARVADAAPSKISVVSNCEIFMRLIPFDYVPVLSGLACRHSTVVDSIMVRRKGANCEPGQV
jgi:hypothetical protein